MAEKIRIAEIEAGIGLDTTQMNTQIAGIPGMFSGMGANILAVAGLASVAAAFMELGTNAITAFTEIETGMSKISTMTEFDASSQSIVDMKNAFFDISTTVPVAMNDLTEAGYQALSAGVNFEEVAETVEAASIGAVGGFTDVTTALDGMTSIMNIYGDSVGSAGDVMDRFVQTQNVGKTTVGELAGAIGRVAPLAANLGLSFDELSAGLATVTSQGISTNETVTYMKSMLTNISKVTPTAALAAKNLGIQFSATAMKSKGLGNFLAEIKDKSTELADKLNEIPESTKNAFDLQNPEQFIDAMRDVGASVDGVYKVSEKGKVTLTTFGKKLLNAAKNGANATSVMQNFFASSEAVTAVLALGVENGDKFNNSLEKMRDATGVADEAAGKMSATFSAQWQMMKSSFLPMLEELGGLILSNVFPALKDLGDIIRKTKPLWGLLFNPLKVGLTTLREFVNILDAIISPLTKNKDMFILWGDAAERARLKQQKYNEKLKEMHRINEIIISEQSNIIKKMGYEEGTKILDAFFKNFDPNDTNNAYNNIDAFNNLYGELNKSIENTRNKLLEFKDSDIMLFSSEQIKDIENVASNIELLRSEINTLLRESGGKPTIEILTKVKELEKTRSDLDKIIQKATEASKERKIKFKPEINENLIKEGMQKAGEITKKHSPEFTMQPSINNEDLKNEIDEAFEATFGKSGNVKGEKFNVDLYIALKMNEQANQEFVNSMKDAVTIKDFQDPLENVKVGYIDVLSLELQHALGRTFTSGLQAQINNFFQGEGLDFKKLTDSLKNAVTGVFSMTLASKIGGFFEKQVFNDKLYNNIADFFQKSVLPGIGSIFTNPVTGVAAGVIGIGLILNSIFGGDGKHAPSWKERFMEATEESRDNMRDKFIDGTAQFWSSFANQAGETISELFASDGTFAEKLQGFVGLMKESFTGLINSLSQIFQEIDFGEYQKWFPGVQSLVQMENDLIRLKQEYQWFLDQGDDLSAQQKEDMDRLAAAINVLEGDIEKAGNVMGQFKTDVLSGIEAGVDNWRTYWKTTLELNKDKLAEMGIDYETALKLINDFASQTMESAGEELDVFFQYLTTLPEDEWEAAWAAFGATFNGNLNEMLNEFGSMEELLTHLMNKAEEEVQGVAESANNVGTNMKKSANESATLTEKLKDALTSGQKLENVFSGLVGYDLSAPGNTLAGTLEIAKSKAEALKNVFKELAESGEYLSKGDISGGAYKYGLSKSEWDALSREEQMKIEDSWMGAAGHAGGLNFVPFDNYPAMLHKGETVLTKEEANDWRAMRAGYFNSYNSGAMPGKQIVFNFQGASFGDGLTQEMVSEMFRNEIYARSEI